MYGNSHPVVAQERPAGRIFIVDPVTAEAESLAAVLARAGLTAKLLDNLNALAEAAGPEPGVLLIAEEALVGKNGGHLREALSRQAAWSEIPVIVIVAEGVRERESRVRQLFGPASNTEFLERPFRDSTLVGMLRLAVQARRRQFEVRDLLRRRESLLNGISDGFMSIDRSGRITFINERMAGFLRRPREQLKGASAWELLPGGNGSRLREEIRKAWESGGDVRFEQYVEAWQCWLDFHMRGSGEGLEVFAADATEKKRAEETVRRNEERLRQAQKFEAIGKLASGIAHDFNNLLTAINGYSDLVLSMMRPDDVLRPNVEEIRKAGDRAARLTQQLLTYSRQRAMNIRLIDLNETLRNVDIVLRRLVGEDVEVEFRLDPDTAKINADPGQIEQMMMNLAENAHDAMPSGGRLLVATTNRHLDESDATRYAGARPGPYSVLTVRDTGLGMTDEVKGRIFEPFFTTKDSERAAGLGLSAVQGVVRQSGGFIRVNSAPGQGTSFELFFPHAEHPIEAEQPPPPEPEYGRERETVLVVEDEDMVRDFMAQILRNAGYGVLTAGKGMEAILVSTSFQGDIHMLLTDVVMPGMSGRELAETMVSLRPGIKVLYVSGYTDDAVLQHGVLVGKVAFLNKPFSSRDLLDKVRQVLSARGITAV